MIETCLVGLTGYAEQHLSLIKEAQSAGRIHFRSITILPEVQNAEPEAVDLLKKDGVLVFENVNEMFQEGKGSLQLCFLPTSIASHTPLTIQALEAGCHVLVEKPLAGTSDEVTQLMDARERCDRYVAVGFQDIARRDIHLIKAGMKEKQWGQLQSMNFTALWPRHHTYYQRNAWAGRLKIGATTINDSPANNATVHFLNMGLFIGGDKPNSSAEILSVEGDLYRCREIESFDTISVNLSLDTRLPFRYSVSHSSSEKLEESLDLHTDEGVLSIANRGSFWTPHGGEKENLTVDDANKGRKNMVHSLLDHIQEGQSMLPHCSLEIAGAHVKAIESLHRDLKIKDVHRDFVTNDDDISCIDGMHETMKKARSKNMTFEEMGVDYLLN